jgi:hypothetical protein
MNRQRVEENLLSLPEVRQQRTWGHPTFRVNGRMFASRYVLVPDAWHGGWHFQSLTDALRHHGYETHPGALTSVCERSPCQGDCQSGYPCRGQHFDPQLRADQARGVVYTQLRRHVHH